MTATPLSLALAGTVALAVGATVAVALDRLYARLGYHEHYPNTRRRTRVRMAGYGSLCGLAAALALTAATVLPLALPLGALALAVRRELVPRPEFVPIHELEPNVGPGTDATVVEDGLVLADLLSEWYVWGPLALLAGAVEVGARAALGWPVPTAPSIPLPPELAATAAVALGVAYPLAIVLRRPWRRTSFDGGAWYVAVGFWAFAWGGTALTLGVAAFLLARFGLVVPLATLTGVLVLAHLPPDEGDAPVELVLSFWPGALAGAGLLAGVEWGLRYALL